jgi:hypothetical protein
MRPGYIKEIVGRIKQTLFPPDPDDMTIEERAAYQAGYDADPYARNPHPRGTIYYHAWQAGQDERDREDLRAW